VVMQKKYPYSKW